MPFENFEVKPLEEAFDEYFSGQYRPPPVERLKSYLTGFKPKAGTAVIETEYIDVDYSASYHEQLGRSFTPIKKETTRIHFFGEHLTKRRLMNASDSTVRQMKSSYMGFTVVRPDWPPTLGRTFIKYPTHLGEKPARFPTRGTTPVDLAGIPLRVDSCPYMSQDQKVMACATAALWMASTPLAEKIPEIAWHSTAQITRMAMSLNRTFGPVLGRRGLDDQEMEQALLEIGFDPSFHLFPDPEELVDVCHLYTDSGIPPVLIVLTTGGWHAVTVVGYTLKSPQPVGESPNGLIQAHQFISNLVIHDDQRGMYLLARVCESQFKSERFATDLLVEMPDGMHQLCCKAILVPQPTRVMLDEEAGPGCRTGPAPTVSSTCCAPAASGKPWTPPAFAPAPPPTCAFSNGPPPGCSWSYGGWGWNAMTN